MQVAADLQRCNGGDLLDFSSVLTWRTEFVVLGNPGLTSWPRFGRIIGPSSRLAVNGTASPEPAANLPAVQERSVANGPTRANTRQRFRLGKLGADSRNSSETRPIARRRVLCGPGIGSAADLAHRAMMSTQLMASVRSTRGRLNYGSRSSAVMPMPICIQFWPVSYIPFGAN